MSATSKVFSCFGLRGCSIFLINSLAQLPFKTGAFSGRIIFHPFSSYFTRKLRLSNFHVLKFCFFEIFVLYLGVDDYIIVCSRLHRFWIIALYLGFFHGFLLELSIKVSYLFFPSIFTFSPEAVEFSVLPNPLLSRKVVCWLVFYVV